MPPATRGAAVCTSAAQCGAGYTCSNETPKRFCRPSCSEGQGACFVAGVRKCGVGVGQCCQNDTSDTCNDIVPPIGTAEVCNGIDDNCNGFVDENLSCQGCVPLPEVCDGKDNDCDGLVDETGPGGLVDIGGPCGSSWVAAHRARRRASTKRWSASGATGPFVETCNGYDDDCDGVVDGMKPGLLHRSSRHTRRKHVPRRHSAVHGCRDERRRTVGRVRGPAAAHDRDLQRPR